MKIERHGPSWTQVLNVARLTQNKLPVPNEPSDEWKCKLIKSRHSPLRLIQFFVVETAPGFVLNHLARHSYQSPQPFIGTSRTDIMNTEERPPDTTIKPFAWYINADSWLDIYEQRACYKVSKETREFVLAMKDEIEKIEPLIAQGSFRKCEKEGVCTEFKPCGHMKTVSYENNRRKYVMG